MVTSQQEIEYLARKKRMKNFYASKKLKGVKRSLNASDWCNTIYI